MQNAITKNRGKENKTKRLNISRMKKYLVGSIVVIIFTCGVFFFINKYYFYYEYAFNAKLVTQIPVKNLIDKSILQKSKNHLPMYSIERSKNLKTIFTDAEVIRPVGIGSIAQAVDNDKDTIENIIEPWLIRLRLITKTSQGRQISELGLKHL